MYLTVLKLFANLEFLFQPMITRRNAFSHGKIQKMDQPYQETYQLIHTFTSKLCEKSLLRRMRFEFAQAEPIGLANIYSRKRLNTV